MAEPLKRWEFPFGEEKYWGKGRTREEAYENARQAAIRATEEDFAYKPWYKKLGQTADDMVRNFADSLTLGYSDRIAAADMGDLSPLNPWSEETPRLKEERWKTEAGRIRNPEETTGARIAGILGLGKAAPTTVPRVTRAIGGPLPVRAATAAATGAAEGAAFGGGEAIIRDEPIGEGLSRGAIGGVLGQAAGGAMRAGAEGAASLGRRVTGAPPVTPTGPNPAMVGRKRGPGGKFTKGPTTAQQSISEIEQAIRSAEVSSKGGRGFDTAIESEFTKLLKNEPRSALVAKYGEEGVQAMETLAYGDRATRVARKAGKISLGQGLGSAIPGTGVGHGITMLGQEGGGTFGTILTGLANIPLAAGIGGRTLANAGARRNTRELRRIIDRLPPAARALSETQQQALARLVTLGFLDMGPGSEK